VQGHARRGTALTRRHESAFTLIELLVVISIISVLMSVLMPSLSRVRKQARAVACRGLLKQWGSIWYLYCNDNNGSFASGNTNGIDWRRGEWIISLRDLYETKSEIVRCVSATKRLADGSAYGGPYNTYVMGVGGADDLQEEASYGQNNWLFNPPSRVTAVQGRPSAWHWRNVNVRGAANIPVFSDTMWRGGGPYAEGTGGEPPQSNGQWLGADREIMHFAIDRHEGSVNQVFLDWSVRAVGIKELWTLKWHKTFNTRGPWTLAGGVQQSDWPQWMAGFKDY